MSCVEQSATVATRMAAVSIDASRQEVDTSKIQSAHLCHIAGFCLCNSGFQATSNDSSKCDDINESANHTGICSQLCENLPGSFKCSCHKEYILLSDNRTCRAKGEDPILLLTSRENIRQVCAWVGVNKLFICFAGRFTYEILRTASAQSEQRHRD